MLTRNYFIPIDYDYFDLEGRNYANIFEWNDKDKKVCIFRIY